MDANKRLKSIFAEIENSFWYWEILTLKIMKPVWSFSAIMIILLMLLISLSFQESEKTFTNFMCPFGINKLSKIHLKTSNGD